MKGGKDMPHTKKVEEKLSLAQDEIKALKELMPDLKQVANSKKYQEMENRTSAGQEIKVKMWNELTVEEKIERMREQVRDHMQRVQRQLASMDNSIRQIKRHTHNEKGVAIVEQNLTDYYGSDGMLGAANVASSTMKSTETYF